MHKTYFIMKNYELKFTCKIQIVFNIWKAALEKQGYLWILAFIHPDSTETLSQFVSSFWVCLFSVTDSFSKPVSDIWFVSNADLTPAIIALAWFQNLHILTNWGPSKLFFFSDFSEFRRLTVPPLRRICQDIIFENVNRFQTSTPFVI